MQDQYVVVVTSINAPTPAVIDIARDAGRLSAHFVVVGDAKSPADFHQDGADYLDLAAQGETGFALAAVAPTGHYARKNLGYLHAIRRGATVIIETDDDNIPLDDFWSPRALGQTGPVVRDAGWTNAYRYFTAHHVWPRGFPLTLVQSLPTDLATVETRVLDCPIQQGLANRNPDVDAIYRLTLPLPIDFDRRGPVLLAGSTWCPFNSQNTTWWRQAFPLLYLPSYCSFRMTDIWRGFVAQRILAANDWAMTFHQATVVQDRNEHDLMRDFADEISGYLNNERIVTALAALDLPSGRARICDNLVRCYRILVEMALVDPRELTLLDAWIKDLGDLDPVFRRGEF